MAPLLRSLRLISLARFRRFSFLPPPPPLSQNRRTDELTCFRKTARCLSSVAEVLEFDDGLHGESEATQKDAALRQALTQLSDEFGKESMLFLPRFFGSRRAPVIPTGSLKLDLALGIGGLPKGRMVEIFGREASGKTTLALHIIKEAQKLGGYCAYLDVENALDPSLAESIGVSMENLLISPPDSAENLLSMVDTLTKSGSVDVIVIDSASNKVAALVPQCELDTLIGNNNVDMQSRILTRALRKIQSSLCHSGTLILFLNQVRSDVKSGHVLGHVNEVTCGGNALKFYSAVRLRMIRTRLLKTEREVNGLEVRVQVVKNKLAPAMKDAELGIQFGRGFCFESEILELACEHGVITKEGNSYLIEGEVFSNQRAAEDYMAKNDGVLDKMISTLRKQLFERKM